MSQASQQLRGAFTAIITPFKDGEVDTDALIRLVERQIDGGIDGLVPCGTTGESATLSAEERLHVIRTVAEAAEGRVPIVAGTGSNDTRASVAFTRKVAEIKGVDYALVVVPYYNKPSQDGLYRHFTAVADDGGLPVMLYNVPSRTVVSLAPDTVGRLSEHENIVAIKEATADMRFDSEVLAACEGRISVLSGDDFSTLPLLSIGGDGCVSVVSNIDPTAMSKMCRAAREYDWPTAERIHHKIQPLARALFTEPNPVPTKIMAEHLGWCSSEVRGPLFAPAEASAARLRGIIDAYDFEEQA